MKIIVVALVALSACYAQRRYDYVAPDGATRAQTPPVKSQVISVEQAQRLGLAGEPLSLPFTADADGPALVSAYLASVDARELRYVSGLAITLASTQDEQPIECRTEVVPDDVTVSQWIPPKSESVRVSKPVTRTVTEWERQCHTNRRLKTDYVTSYERRCEWVRKPVQRSRTVYRQSYDYYSKSYRSQPQTEYYTDYVNEQECKTEPVQKLESNWVSEQDCNMAPVTRTVTRYEWQYENHYVPGRYETFTRQRLRELEPVCYVVDVAAGNRVEGTVYR